MDTSEIRKWAKKIAALGKGRDLILAHINPEEAALLARLNGGTINPDTNLPSFGWLQDIGSEFSIRRPFQLVSDPHKFATTEMTKGFQRTVGPIALRFIPGVGPYASMAARAWLAHESHNPASANYKAPDSSAGAQAAQGAATEAVAQNTGMGSSGGGFGSILGQIFGGQSASGAKMASTKTIAPQQNAQILQLQQQVEALKQQIQAHYAGANDALQAQDVARVDQWYNQQVQQINQQQQALQQQAAQQ